MAADREQLVKALYAAYESGTMPERIRVNYKTFASLMCDDAFYAEVEYSDKQTTFQSLPFVIDKSCWPDEIKIEGRQRLDGE